jgi:sugar phosphate isomerase/epimerase
VNGFERYAFSIGWNVKLTQNAVAAVEEVVEMGFRKLELTGVAEECADSLKQYLAERPDLKVVSVHTFCPRPPGRRPGSYGDVYNLASLDESERLEGVHYAKRTIEFAADVGADVVVVHLGRVDVEYVSRTIYGWSREFGFHSEEYRSRLNGLLEERARAQPPHFDRALESFDVLASYALETGVRLAAENRYMYYEIPNVAELKIIMQEFGDSPAVGCWYDIGHAYVNDILGVESHTAFFDVMKDLLLGTHLHDVMDDWSLDPGKTDHRAPPGGLVDFLHAKSVLPDDVLRVIELRKEVTRDEVVRGVHYLESIEF